MKPMNPNDSNQPEAEEQRKIEETQLRAEQMFMVYGPPNAQPPFGPDTVRLAGAVACRDDLNPAAMPMGMMQIFPKDDGQHTDAKWLSDSEWECPCGTHCTGKFCPECGKSAPPKPAKWVSETEWQCTCGTHCTGKFCPECGKPAPEKPAKWVSATEWKCICGTVCTGKFCPECGYPAPEKQS